MRVRSGRFPKSAAGLSFRKSGNRRRANLARSLLPGPHRRGLCCGVSKVVRAAALRASRSFLRASSNDSFTPAGRPSASISAIDLSSRDSRAFASSDMNRLIQSPRWAPLRLDIDRRPELGPRFQRLETGAPVDGKVRKLPRWQPHRIGPPRCRSRRCARLR
jgi:hypothetical protein